jgi:hypothetical protein
MLTKESIEIARGKANYKRQINCSIVQKYIDHNNGIIQQFSTEENLYLYIQGIDNLEDAYKFHRKINKNIF